MKKPCFWSTLATLAVLFCSFSVVAKNDKNTFQNIYNEQFKISGASQLQEKLPKETLQTLDKLEIHGNSWEEISSLGFEKVFNEITGMGKEKAYPIFKSILPLTAIMLLCALIKNLGVSFEKHNLNKVLSAVSTLCICMCLIEPLIKCITSGSLIIKSAAGFMLCYVPIMAGIMVASGKGISATSYHVLVMGAGQIVAQIAGNFITPIMNTVLGLTMISLISPGLRLKSLCDFFHKTVKWILEFSVSLFVGILTLQNIVSSAADNVACTGVRLALSGCVPVVGGALGDAFSSVQGCVKLLKSGVGAFGVIAGLAIFLPIICQCGAWVLFLNLSACMGDVFDLREMSEFIRSVSKIMSTLFALVLSAMTVLIVSTVLMLVIGGN